MNDEIAAIENFYQWLLRKDYTIAKYVGDDLYSMVLVDLPDLEMMGDKGFTTLLREFEEEHYDTLD